MRKTMMFVAFMLVFAVSMPLIAGEKAMIDISADIYKSRGETTYKISGSDFMFVGDTGSSVLEFPINTLFSRVGIHANLMQKIDFSLDYSWSIDDDPGKFKDSDFSSLLATKPAIYGVYNAKIDAKEWNFDFKYLLTEQEITNSIIDRLKVYLGAGFKSQKFDFTETGGKTEYYYLATSVTDTDSASGIDYAVEYKILYLSLYVDLLNTQEKIDLLLGIEYGPSIDAEDRDDHLLRSKLSVSTGDGTYGKFAAQLNWNIWNNVFASIYYNYIDISVAGHQDQSFYGGAYQGLEYRDIDWTSDSEQSIYGAKVTWYFN
ncbi:MAG: omptin family outer membrane protease [Candidatus Aureabacteria bacterium]|nr:omptin family outer membrane protease [Candidatus Auribacterota bacterium]